MENQEIDNIDQKQIEELKENIINQIKNNNQFSGEQKEQFAQKIHSLDKEGFIEFLKKQGIIKDPDSEQSNETKQTGSSQDCIFCSIVFGDIPSRKIDENEKAIAVLEINPLSKGHTMIIPKDHISDKDKIPEEAKNMAIKISQRIKSKLKPKEVKFEGKEMFGHQVLNIIPLYEGQDPEQLQQKKASEEELSELEETLKEEREEKTSKNEEEDKNSGEEGTDEKEINEKNTWLPKRIP